MFIRGKFMRMIYPELIKNRIPSLCIFMLFVSSVASVAIAVGCTKLDTEGIVVSEKGLAYVTLCQVFLLFIIPIGIMLLSILFNSWEEKFGGWRIVMTSRVNIGSVHSAKISLIFVIVFVMMIPLIICGAICFEDFGTGTVLNGVMLPLMAACLCFFPMCVLMYFTAFLMSGALPVIFIGLLFVISTIFVSGSFAEKYDPLCYPYVIAMNYDNVAVRIAFSACVSVLMLIVGTAFSRRRISR